ncbi:MAG: protein kinase [Opitutales bacterium]|nr:protein kinase [Opitutales bacterium]
MGRGGVGVVFAAYDEVLEEEVALKFIHALLLSQPGIVKTLKEEVKRARHLTHPNIVGVFEVHQEPGAVAIAMERIGGPSLAVLSRRSPDRVLSADDILTWLPGIVSALDHAHRSAKIVHRDIKPGNILLHADGSAKIADFGLSRTIADEVTVTMGMAAGTVAYMSPQQMMGDPCSPADDIYSLGASLYDLLTGKPPFHTGHLPSQIEGVEAELLNARRESLGVKGPPLPFHWEAAVAACLAKDPANRPTTATELLEMLQGKRAPRRRVSAQRGRAISGSWRRMGLAAAGLVATAAAITVNYQMNGDAADSFPATPRHAPALPTENHPDPAVNPPRNPLYRAEQYVRAERLIGSLTSGLLLHLPLENNTRDYSGFGLDGSGRNLAPAVDRFGRQAHAIRLLGDADITVAMPQDFQFSVGRPFAVSLWFLPDLQSGSLIELRTDDPVFPYMHIGYHDGRIRVVPGGNYRDQESHQSQRVVQENAWQYLVAQYDGEKMSVWLDAKKVLEFPYEADPVLANGWSLQVGGSAPRRLHFAGAISDLRLYGKHLPESQILTNFRSRPHRPRTPDSALPPEAARFALTVGIYGDNDDLEAAVKNEFGDSARIADWEEIRDLFYDNGAAFADFIGLCHKTSAFVERDGDRQFLGPRQFMVYRDSGTHNPALLHHDHTAQAELLLGSWFNIEHPILVRLPQGGAASEFLSATRLVGERTDGGIWELGVAPDPKGAARMKASPGASIESSLFDLPVDHRFQTLRIEFNANLPPSLWGKEITLCLRREGVDLPLTVSIAHHPGRHRSIKLQVGTEKNIAHLRLFGARFGDFSFTILVRDEHIYITAIPLRSPGFLFEEMAQVPGFRLADLRSLQWTLHCRDPHAVASWIDDIRLTALSAASAGSPPDRASPPVEP